MKVVCGTVIIASLFLMSLYGVPTLFSVPRHYAQFLVLSGGALTLWHYLILKRNDRNVQNPYILMEARGLFRWVRHPMYCGDILSYTGLVLLAPNLVTVVVLLLSYLALIKQARVEDQFLAKRFGKRYSRWQCQTGLLLPRLM
ncbi:methyltransferase family protein [Arenicella xantha]|uniref:methyltransferase family protein n=1 Tax=Arenicella xantha TaxID=644221 RepID=UPI001B8640F8|nr:methyltransferase [Arenicella xantha]